VSCLDSQGYIVESEVDYDRRTQACVDDAGLVTR